jgi:hypothetical protein
VCIYKCPNLDNTVDLKLVAVERAVLAEEALVAEEALLVEEAVVAQ